jgi:aminoglycoside phosphotransferase (APT) family kinase protein
MHKDEISINDAIVKKLISSQFPKFNDLPVQKVSSMGTVNAIYRLGEELCIRLPRLGWAEKSLNNEWKVLPLICKSVSLAVPEPVEKGKPNADYPLEWAIYNWIQGDIYGSSVINETEAMEALARFIMELREIRVSKDVPKAGRKPLCELNEITVKAINECKVYIEYEKALKLWRELLNTKPWDNNPVWIHADLLKSNLLINNGRLSAVIDFGSAGIGDPAFDVVPAWAVLTSKTRELFRRLLGVDDNTWLRAKAYALHQAALIIPYYRKSNPAFAEQAINTINSII